MGVIEETFAGHEVARASLDNCVKCTICETVCPVAKANPLFTGPKYNGPQAERYRHGASVDHSLEWCDFCGICTLNCPQGVKIAELNEQAAAVMKAQNGVPLRDRIIPETNLEGMLMSPIAPVANWALGLRPLRVAIEKTFKIHRDAPMPTAHTETLAKWLKHRKKPDIRPTKGPVAFFQGCAGGYFETETSKKSIEVLEHLGHEVFVPKQSCCGLAKQSNGLFKGATKDILNLCDNLLKFGNELPVVSSSGSSIGLVKHEAHELMGVEDPRLENVSVRSRDFCEFLMEEYRAGRLDASEFREIDLTVPYHQPCQVKSQGMGFPAVQLMELIPGVKVVESNEPCCGIAGTYGLKAERYDTAQKIGQKVFEHMQNYNEGVGVCDTETCRWQISKSSGVKIVHPVWLLHHALGLSDDLLS